MTTDDHHSAPFPSRGKGRGWGGGTLGPDMAHQATSIGDRSHPAPSHNHPASTPPNPPPRGEGFDRFAGPARIKPGGVQRGRQLRAAPTRAETKLWARLRQLDIRIRRQAPIGPYVVDFACLRAKLVIEVDGGVHERTDVAVRDLERDTWLTGQGFRTLRIPNKRVDDEIEAVVADIEAAIHASLPTFKQPASTQSQPFPPEEKGSSDF